MTVGWDPVVELTGEDRKLFQGRWEKRLWLNVPGPFYTAETDTCWTGRLNAPANVMYAASSEGNLEYVFRQPRNPDELRQLVDAADEEPFQEYAYDGDLRWTPAAVRRWWADRARVSEHLTATLAEYGDSVHQADRDAAVGAREFGAYLEGALAGDLRAYLFRLGEGRYPAAGETLPELGG
ncbi:ferredoxin [Streptomyces sp. H34-S4]|uniref:ferredoxin n=1 Tax=Streptomyces sp. H34-S4 TaxID=2996463 RepID=UPI00226FAD82|nr:ferredoxin [Streptomyces sp. H34-S4]MCY0936019.1 ferredoxin [Streptomyces sp. H34-S4]